MAYRLFGFICVFAVVGCATTTEVTKLGRDTYTLSTYRSPAVGGTTKARQVAISSAGQYCQSIGKEVSIERIETSPTNLAANVLIVIFTCLYYDDPSYQRPVYKREPGVIIEDRR